MGLLPNEFAASLPDQTELLGILCPVRAYTRAAADRMTSVRDGFSDSLLQYTIRLLNSLRSTLA